MSVSNNQPMTLDSDDLSEMDEAVLDWMADHPNVTPTPALLRNAFQERGMTHTRQYYNAILARLAEHGHAENLWDTGVYRLISDPREADDE